MGSLVSALSVDEAGVIQSNEARGLLATMLNIKEENIGENHKVVELFIDLTREEMVEKFISF